MTVKKRRGAGVRVALATLTAGFIAALIAAGSSPARAQDEGILSYPSHPFEVRAGVYLPRNGATRDDLGIDWLSYGVGYDISTSGKKLPHTFSVYADYFNVPKTTGPADFRLRSQAASIGVGVAERYYFMPTYSNFQPYAGAGAGIYDVHAKASDPGGTIDKYKTSIGGKILAGVEIRQGIFVQGDFNWLPEPKLEVREQLEGFQLQLGYRF